MVDTSDTLSQARVTQTSTASLQKPKNSLCGRLSNDYTAKYYFDIPGKTKSLF
jgi:hypothetical protein